LCRRETLLRKDVAAGNPARIAALANAM